MKNRREVMFVKNEHMLFCGFTTIFVFLSLDFHTIGLDVHTRCLPIRKYWYKL